MAMDGAPNPSMQPGQFHGSGGFRWPSDTSANAYKQCCCASFCEIGFAAWLSLSMGLIGACPSRKYGQGPLVVQKLHQNWEVRWLMCLVVSEWLSHFRFKTEPGGMRGVQHPAHVSSGECPPRQIQAERCYMFLEACSDE
jgi:hypothetical protein